jgi:hypothetical protein
MFAWGGGTDGCLGVGGVGDRAIPRPVMLGRHAVRELAVGAFHVAAITTGMLCEAVPGCARLCEAVRLDRAAGVRGAGRVLDPRAGPPVSMCACVREGIREGVCVNV